MESTRWNSTSNDVSSLEKKDDTSEIVNQLVQDLADKVVVALQESGEYFLEEKEHSLFLTLPAYTALRAIGVAVKNRGVMLDPSSFMPHRGLLSHQTGFLLKKIS